MNLIDEIETETWHILLRIYTHQRMVASLTGSATRYELANKLVALSALRELLIVQIARLADKRRDARSVDMLLKRGEFPGAVAAVKEAVDAFRTLAEPVVRIRHEQVAHMKPGIVSSSEPRELPTEALLATKALLRLVDIARGATIGYSFKVGSVEVVIDLRASVAAGEMVAV